MKFVLVTLGSSDPNWREVVCEELLGDNLNDLSALSDKVNSVSDGEYDRNLQEPEIKLLMEATGHAEDLQSFAIYNGRGTSSINI